MITKEFLEGKRAEIQETIAVHNGAVQFIDYLLSVLDGNDGMPIDEFAQMVGGNGATAEMQEAKV